MIILADQNVWLALVLPPHLHHHAARQWWEALSSSRACFCRSTQQGLMRLLTTEAVLKPYGLPPRSQREAWRIYRQLQTDPCVGFAQEPEGVEERWEELSSMDQAAPKLWMDSWLASIAILSRSALVTFDFGFRQFEPAGLQLTLLKPA